MSERDPFDLIGAEDNMASAVKKLRKVVRRGYRRNVSASGLDKLADAGGDLGPTDFLTASFDGDGMHTDANLVDINWWLPLNLADDVVSDIHAIVYDGSEWVYVGGLFERIGGVQASNIARYSLITRQWEEVNGGVNTTVNAIAIRPSDGVVFIGGFFTDAGGAATADYLAYDNSGTWAVVVASLNNTVNTLKFDSNDDLYVGGSFTNAGGNANADRIFMWDGAVNALGSGFASGGLQDINIDGSGNVWAGGNITSFVQKWNGAAWSQPFTFGGGIEVYRIYFDDFGIMYVGGFFTDVGGDSELAYLFKYDGVTASAVGHVLNGNVYDIFVDNSGSVCVAGSFTNAGDVAEADRLAKWNGTNWEALSNGGGASGLDGNVYAMLRLSNGSIIVGGSFNYAGAINCQSIAILCKPLNEAIDVIASLFELYAERTNEAAFTPAIEGTTTAGAGTYSTQLGYYTRTGNVIHFQIHLTWSAHTGTGNIQVAGLPFTAANNGMNPACAVYFSNITLTAVGNKIEAVVAANTKLIAVLQVAGGASAVIPMDTAGDLRITGWYIAA